jgi:hypothetical protein
LGSRSPRAGDEHPLGETGERTLSDPDRHNHENLPIVLAGKGSGTIKTGRHIKYNSAFWTKSEIPLSNLLLSMLDRMGVNADKFGDSNGRVANLDG